MRIGAASAKGFCFGLNIPLVTVNSLDAMAEPYFNGEYDYIIPMMDARRMEVYTKVFNQEGEEVSPTEAKILDENSFSEYQDYKVLFVGDGAKNPRKFSSFQKQNIKMKSILLHNILCVKDQKL